MSFSFAAFLSRKSGMGIYFHENVFILRRLPECSLCGGHLLFQRCLFPSPPSRMFTLWRASTFMKMSLSFAALSNICFIAGIYFCKDVFFLRHICHDHSDNAKIDTRPESPKESSTLTPYFRSFSSSTSYIPRGVHRSVGMTGSPINDNVINGSIPLSTPILYALLVILLIFLLT